MKIFYIVETDGKTWKCHSPFSNTVVVDDTYKDLVFMTNIQLFVELPELNDLVLVKENGQSKIYKAFLINTPIFVSVHKMTASDMQSVWSLVLLNTGEELRLKLPYDKFRDKVEQLMGLKLPDNVKSMELIQADNCMTVYNPYPNQVSESI